MSKLHYPTRCWFVDLVLERDQAAPVLEGDAELAGAARGMRGSAWWDDASACEGDEDRFSARFRDPLGPQSVARGVDPPGSWHQQQNGGTRTWASVAGEIDAR